jgi:hypothetical protein
MDGSETRVTLMITMIASAAVRCPKAIADARATARAFLEGLQQPAVAPDVADTVVLVASELVTDALRHGGGRCTRELTANPDTIELVVHGPNRYVPRTRTPDLNGGTGGFGWPMVTGLAHATAVTRRVSGGKTVSAFFAR